MVETARSRDYYRPAREAIHDEIHDFSDKIIYIPEIGDQFDDLCGIEVIETHEADRMVP